MKREKNERGNSMSNRNTDHQGRDTKKNEQEKEEENERRKKRKVQQRNDDQADEMRFLPFLRVYFVFFSEFSCI